MRLVPTQCHPRLYAEDPSFKEHRCPMWVTGLARRLTRDDNLEEAGGHEGHTKLKLPRLSLGLPASGALLLTSSCHRRPCAPDSRTADLGTAAGRR